MGENANEKYLVQRALKKQRELHATANRHASVTRRRVLSPSVKGSPSG